MNRNRSSTSREPARASRECGPSEADLYGLMAAALNGGTRGKDGITREGITAMLQAIARQTRSFGCILWRATKDAKLSRGEGDLTMLASWFAVRPHSEREPQRDFIGIRSVPLRGSVVGEAAQHPKRTIYCDSLIKSYNSKNGFLLRFHVEKVAARRFTFDDGRAGVISLYRSSEPHPDAHHLDQAHFTQSDFGKTEGDLLGVISKAVPLLYRAVREQASTDLLVRVGKFVRSVSATEQTLVKQVGGAISRTFDSIETAIFLEDEETPGQFRCAWTNPGPHEKNTKAKILKPSLTDGFTALSLYARLPVRVHDTKDSNEEFWKWKQKYKQFTGHTPKGTSKLVDEYFGNPDPKPPYSLLVVPLLADGRLLGCIRCWVAKIGPAYFSSDDEILLQLVADTLGHTIGSKRMERGRERAFARLAGRVYQGRGKNRPDDLYLSYLNLLDNVLPGNLISSVRLVDGKCLRYHVFPGRYAKSAAISTEFDLRGDSLGALAVRTKKRRLFRKGVDIQSDELLENIERMIVCPILVNGRAIAVLDVRALSAADLPQYAESLLQALCQLLGNQLNLLDAERKKNEAERASREAAFRAVEDGYKQEKAMQEAFENVAHQIKSPLAEAARRVATMGEAYERTPLSRDLYELGGLLKRAELTAKLIGLFAAFARGETSSIVGIPISAVDVVKMIGDIVRNQQIKLDPEKAIRFDFDHDSIYKRLPADFSGDPELIYQAVSNLVDNAVKYSYARTIIRITAGRSKSGRFYLAFQNKGLPISPRETRLFKRRNTRGELAEMVTGEGNGLGLYIVDKIMLVHGGELEILPTNPSGVNDIRLYFDV